MHNYFVEIFLNYIIFSRVGYIEDKAPSPWGGGAVLPTDKFAGDG